MATPGKIRREHLLLALGLSASALLCAVAAAVLTGRAAGFDRGVQQWVDSHQLPGMHELLFVVSWLAGITSMRVIAVVSAVAFWYRHKRREAAGMMLVLIAATLLYEAAKRIVGRPRPMAGNQLDPSFAFPSGHATVSAAVCFAIAYVVWHERLVRRSTARFVMTVAALIPFVVGISRVYLDMHWATDVVGGWCAGVAVAAIAAALYEAAPSPDIHSR